VFVPDEASTYRHRSKTDSNRRAGPIPAISTFSGLISMILPISYGSGAGLPGDKNVERSVSGDIHVGLDREATRKISGSGVERTAAGRRPTDRNVRIRF